MLPPLLHALLNLVHQGLKLYNSESLRAGSVMLQIEFSTIEMADPRPGRV
jgi:hypothetical protein